MSKGCQNIMDRIEDALIDIKNGKMVILVDDEDRENEGDLIIAAEKATPEIINFLTCRRDSKSNPSRTRLAPPVNTMAQSAD